jgi:hypothetical protein
VKLISVAVPVFSPPERYLRAKLDSVLRQLDDNHCCSTLPALANRFVGPNQGAQLLGRQSLRPRGSCPAMGPLFKPGAGSGESQIGDIDRRPECPAMRVRARALLGRPPGQSPDPRADSTVNPA